VGHLEFQSCTNKRSVPGHDHASIGYALDAGASIVVPQVDTVEQAKHIISAAKFGSKIGGTRSAPPGRLMPGFSDQCYDTSLSIWQNQNEQAAIVFQIESLEGIDNLDAILTEVGDHVDSIWLGSLDCRVSMGLPGFAGDEPEWLEAVAKFQAALKKHNKPYSGFAIGPPEVKAQMGRGRSFIIVESDVFSIVEAGARSLYHAREAFPAQDFSQSTKV
jgi:4-hydroxy-2-oxoheptanedioate aldolase